MGRPNLVCGFRVHKLHLRLTTSDLKLGKKCKLGNFQNSVFFFFFLTPPRLVNVIFGYLGSGINQNIIRIASYRIKSLFLIGLGHHGGVQWGGLSYRVYSLSMGGACSHMVLGNRVTTITEDSTSFMDILSAVCLTLIKISHKQQPNTMSHKFSPDHEELVDECPLASL